MGHNPAAAVYVRDQIQAKRSKGQKIHLVFSAMEDKNIAEMVEVFRPLVDCWQVCALDHPRAASLKKLKEVCAGVKGYFYPSVADFFAEASVRIAKEDLVVVFGSFVLLKECLEHMKETVLC